MCLMSKSKIIIAEDDTVLRDLYLRKFSSEIYDIRTASNGQEALDYMMGRDAFADRDSFPLPDLILLDLKLPS